jgi:ribonuclease BN (tRNA processing enzyme)
MPNVKPKSLTIRSYQVGFGDCFLLTFHYNGKTGDRHVLIDFGSTGQKKSMGENLMLRVAEDIKKQCNGKLHAVVATHRHKDHISGFATNKKGNGSGDIIASCKPDVVLQPWTEHPKARVDATAAPTNMTANKAFVAALGNMHAISAAVLVEAERRKSMLGATTLRELTFLGEDNLSNLSAVENLMSMGKKNFYLNFGSKSGLERVLPGVKTRVLGPPTLKQSSEIKIQRSKDEDEFWQFQALANQFVLKPQARIFRRAKTYTALAAPPFTRWFIKKMRSIRGEQLLGIVRALDKVMNNTSLILLFEVNGKKLLFPGDAQIENWSYALSKPKIKRLLSTVNVYKVGHHGSRNATPKTLWNGFKNRSKKKTDKKRLKSFMSTMPGKHGNSRSKTEVPRQTLVDALEGESELFTTTSLKKGTISLACDIKL